MERVSPLPLLSGLATGMVLMHVFDRYSERTWSREEVLVAGLLGGLGLATELVRLTWSLAQRRGRDSAGTALEPPRRTDPAPAPRLPAPRVVAFAPETVQVKEEEEPSLPEPPAEPSQVLEVRREEVEEPLPVATPEWPSFEPPEAASPPAELASEAERLTALWNLYLAEGSGLFSVRGLKRQLDQGELGGDVLSGESLGLSDSVAAVDLRDEWSRLYLVPSFTRSTLAVADWFDAPSSIARTALVKKLLRPAILGRTTEGWQCTRRGAVE